LWRKQGHPRELYPDASTKDAPVSPDLPVPNYDCGCATEVFQSRHPDTAACCFYTCSRFNVSNSFCTFFIHLCWNLIVKAHERCFFFQWINGSDKFDPRYLLFDDWWRGRHPCEHFERWVPPPPNPLPMTAKEKHLATVR
jgi:hypothetical protein